MFTSGTNGGTATRGRRLLGLLATATAVVLAVSGCSGDSSPDLGQAASAASSDRPTGSGAETPSTDFIADVQVDGRTIHVTCVGPTDGTEPTVVLEAGLGASSDTWDTVVDALSSSRRTCAYDRAGTGASPQPPTTRRTTDDLVGDLQTVLEKAEVEGPIVLVGHSMAVWPLAVYAGAHPQRVAGVVLVDPRGPRVSAGWRAALPAPTAGEAPAVTANR